MSHPKSHRSYRRRRATHPMVTLLGPRHGSEVPHPVRATKTALLDLVVLHRQGPFLAFLAATEKASAVRTLESLARIELGAQGGALVERVTTTRTAKDGTATTTVRERFTPHRNPSARDNPIAAMTPTMRAITEMLWMTGFG